MQIETHSEPQVLENVRRDDRVMEVRYRLAPGRYARAAVPHESWIQGHGEPGGRHLLNMLRELDLQSETIGSRIPD